LNRLCARRDEVENNRVSRVVTKSGLIGVAIVALVLVTITFFGMYKIAAAIANEEYMRGHVYTVMINKNQPVAIGGLICSASNSWGSISNGELVEAVGSKNFSYIYQGREKDEIMISFGATKTIKLPIDKKEQAILDVTPYQKLLITVVDKENHIIVKGLGDFKSEIIKYADAK
jgi:hypothetical protein